MTPPASPRLPEAVEQAIYAADEVNTRIAETPNGSDLTDLYTEWYEAITALRAATLAYGAARERQGIERAARCLDALAEVIDDLEESRVCVSVGADHIRALPVDGATP